jgi:cytochrome bd-type quinol oxidase subunit 2
MHIGTSSSQPETEEHMLSVYLVFVPSSLLAFLFSMFLLRHRDRAHVVHISNTYAFIFYYLPP